MHLYTLRRTQHIPQHRSVVFPFFATPENLETITPPSFHMHILTPRPIEMREGAIFDYYIETRGLNLRWTSMIINYNPPYSFDDLQIAGPYSFWHHTHTFKEKQGETIIQDEVRYALPYGILGEIAHRLFIQRDLEAIFDYRQSVLAEHFSK